MNKPLGYYTDGHPLLNELQEEYGSTFEKLERINKLFLLQGIIDSMVNIETKLIGANPARLASTSIQPTINQINRELPSKYLLGLADALVNQLKYQR